MVSKISLLTYKILHEKQPVYLYYMLATSLPSHSLRSSKGTSLSVPRVKTNTGVRAFHSCTPSLWNLPLSVEFSHFSCYLQETSQDTSLWLVLSPRPPAHQTAHWCYGTVSSILLLNTDLAVVPVSLALPGILGVREIWSIDWLIISYFPTTSIIPNFQELEKNTANLMTTERGSEPDAILFAVYWDVWKPGEGRWTLLGWEAGH